MKHLLLTLGFLVQVLSFSASASPVRWGTPDYRPEFKGVELAGRALQQFELAGFKPNSTCLWPAQRQPNAYLIAAFLDRQPADLEGSICPLDKNALKMGGEPFWFVSTLKILVRENGEVKLWDSEMGNVGVGTLTDTKLTITDLCTGTYGSNCRAWIDRRDGFLRALEKPSAQLYARDYAAVQP